MLDHKNEDLNGLDYTPFQLNQLDLTDCLNLITFNIRN